MLADSQVCNPVLTTLRVEVIVPTTDVVLMLCTFGILIRAWSSVFELWSRKML